jgi:hypothetical protein
MMPTLSMHHAANANNQQGEKSVKDKEGLIKEPAYRVADINLFKNMKIVSLLLQRLHLVAIENEAGDILLADCVCRNCRDQLPVLNVAVQHVRTLPGCRYGCATPPVENNSLRSALTKLLHSVFREHTTTGGN